MYLWVARLDWMSLISVIPGYLPRSRYWLSEIWCLLSFSLCASSSTYLFIFTCHESHPFKGDETNKTKIRRLFSYKKTKNRTRFQNSFPNFAYSIMNIYGLLPADMNLCTVWTLILKYVCMQKSRRWCRYHVSRCRYIFSARTEYRPTISSSWSFKWRKIIKILI